MSACRIIDISLSGAGIAHRRTGRRSAAIVTLGKIPGRVVRHLEDGFAIEFTRLQHPDFARRERDRTVNAAFPAVLLGAAVRRRKPAAAIRLALAIAAIRR